MPKNNDTLRLPKINTEVFSWALGYVTSIIDGKVQTEDPTDYEIDCGGVPVKLDDSQQSRIYLALRKELKDIGFEHGHVFSLTTRLNILFQSIGLTEFSNEVNDDKTHITPALMDSVASFPLWAEESLKTSIERLLKFLKNRES